MKLAPKQSLAELAPEKKSGALREFWLLLRHKKKYWMFPLFLMLFLVGFLVIIGGSPAAPFIYRLF
jgi:hypothetical protein